MLFLADRGQRLEPQNSFFDWMKLAALIALHRDDEAIRVLHAASNKRGYDSHLRDQISATVATYQRIRADSGGRDPARCYGFSPLLIAAFVLRRAGKNDVAADFRRNLRQIAAGCLLLYVFLYPLAGLLVTPVDRQFDREFRQAIIRGQYLRSPKEGLF